VRSFASLLAQRNKKSCDGNVFPGFLAYELFVPFRILLMRVLETIFLCVFREFFEEHSCCVLSCSVLQCFILSCGVLQCVAVCSSVLQCVAVCCRVCECIHILYMHTLICNFRRWRACIHTHTHTHTHFLSLSLSLSFCLLHSLSHSQPHSLTLHTHGH